MLDYKFDFNWLVAPCAVPYVLGMLRSSFDDAPLDWDTKMVASLREMRDAYVLPFAKVKGTAVVPIQGLLKKQMSLADVYYGANVTGYDKLKQAVSDIYADETIENVVFVFDTPGGQAMGIQGVSEFIHSNKAGRNLYGLVSDMALSGGYWFGSVVDKLYLTGDMSVVGSIGVISLYEDVTKLLSDIGIKINEVYAGKQKTVGAYYKEMSEEDRVILQGEVNQIYDVFVNQVSKYRGLDPKAIRDTEAGVYMGKKAIDMNLADDIVNYDKFINNLTSKYVSYKIDTSTVNKGGVSMPEEKQITLEVIKKDYPQLADALREEGQMSLSKDLDSLKVQVGELSKQLHIERGKALLATVESIWTARLSASTLPQAMHDKVKLMVSHQTFIKDGVFDAVAFASAVDAELKSWDVILPSVSAPSVLGLGTAKGDQGDKAQVVTLIEKYKNLGAQAK